MGNNADRCFTDLCNTDWFAIDLQMDALQIYRSLLYKSTDGAMHYRSLLYKSTDGAMLCKFRFMFVNVVFWQHQESSYKNANVWQYICCLLETFLIYVNQWTNLIRSDRLIRNTYCYRLGLLCFHYNFMDFYKCWNYDPNIKLINNSHLKICSNHKSDQQYVD